MHTKLALGAIAAAVAVFSQGAFAQASSPTRAEVKAEAKTGSLAPAGQGPIGSAPSKSSDTSRAERKATTKMARDAGTLKPAGEGSELKNDLAEKNKASVTTRAERKATTTSDIKSGKTQPAGDTPQPVGEAPKK